jgi:hypothetical protein
MRLGIMANYPQLERVKAFPASRTAPPPLLRLKGEGVMDPVTKSVTARWQREPPGMAVI